MKNYELLESTKTALFRVKPQPWVVSKETMDEIKDLLVRDVIKQKKVEEFNDNTLAFFRDMRNSVVEMSSELYMKSTLDECRDNMIRVSMITAVIDLLIIRNGGNV